MRPPRSVPWKVVHFSGKLILREILPLIRMLGSHASLLYLILGLFLARGILPLLL